MFFKVKCPYCGYKNAKERMTCAECGAPLALGQVEERLAEVPQEGEPNLAITTKQSAGQKRGVWFWVGVVLLSISALWWLFCILGILLTPEAIGEIILTGITTTVVPIGIAIYCLRRGRKAQAAQTARAPEPTSEPIEKKEESEEEELSLEERRRRVGVEPLRMDLYPVGESPQSVAGGEGLPGRVNQVKRPSEIKEQDEQRMVIGSTIVGQLGMAFVLVFVVIWTFVALLIPNILVKVLFGGVGVLLILVTLRTLIGIKTVIDKLPQTITINKRSFFLTSRQRAIPFSDVRNVVIDYQKITSGSGGPYGGGTTSQDAWKVSLDIGENVEIKHTTKKANMLHLASEISRFIGRELVDNSAKPESSFTGLFRKVKGFFRKGSG